MKQRILIVDDMEMNRKLLVNMLQDSYEILEAGNGIEALESMRSVNGELSAILLDIMMPQMDGYEVLRRMQVDEMLSGIPVIVTTGNTEIGAEIEALNIGAIEYITKPYHPDLIKQRLRNIIKLREDAAIVNAIKTDALTGLYSRTAFFEKAAEMISQQEPGYYVMACFDIEKFKIINDQYGNKKGDEVLKYIAHIFEEGFRQCGGICSRIMADNYAVLYPKSFMKSKEIAEIRRKAEMLDGSILPITFGIGRYIADDISLSPSAMYDKASLAKEYAKGRFDKHVVEYNESMRNKILREQEIIGEMKQALANNQFEVWFQPQYNHSTGALVGAEALIRWRHPKRGLVAPGSFIPTFEKNGFVYEVDKFVWEQVCLFQQQCLKAGGTPLPVSVNISRYDIFRKDLVDVISGLIQKYNIPAELLHLEITESAFSKASAQIIKVVKTFQKLGFIIEIDDFGSGYSSLNMLKDVPANTVKLDMRFLEGEDSSGRGGSILESIVRMTRWLGMSVVAEGVETTEQADFLKTIGCNYMQGYLYARPMPASDYQTLFADCRREKKPVALVTVKNLDNNAFWSPKSLDTLIFNSYIGAACVLEYHNEKIEILRANEKHAQVIGDVGMTIEDAIKINWFEYLNEKDTLLLQNALKRSIELNDEITEEYTFWNLPGCPKKTYLRTTLRVIAISGEHYLIYCTNENMTALREAEMKEQKTAEHMQSIMENVSSGITATIIRGEEVEILFVNNRYYEILGYTKEQYEKEIIRTYDLIYPEDRQRVFEAVEETNKNGKTKELEYRAIRRDKKVIWLKNVISMTTFSGIDEPVQLGICTDITGKKQAEEADRIHKEEMQIAMSQMGKMICEYNPITKTMTMPEAYAKWYGVATQYANMPYSVLGMNIIKASDVDSYIQFYESIINGKKAGAYDVTIKRIDGTWHNEHYEFVSIFNDEGKPIKAILSVEDTTEQEETKRRYEHEVQLRRELVRESLIYYEMNLATDMIEEYLSLCEDVPSMKSNMPLNELMRTEILRNVVEEDREKVRSTMFSDALKEAYKRGETNISLEYRRNIPGQGICWVRTNIALMKKPETEEPIAFLYVNNIDIEKKTQIALDHVLDDEVDVVAILNVKSGCAYLAKAMDHADEMNKEVFHYGRRIEKLIQVEIVEEDREACKKFFQIDNLKKALQKESYVMLLYRVIHEDESILRKRAIAFYLDETCQDIVISRRDITVLFEEEQKQKQALQNAVNAANKANSAKSDFLSKMSHDMRTPLNAVLAFSNEEMTENADEAKLREYLDKIHSSGDYLLGIINDVLDMSKIEQNKMVLNPSPFEFKEFVGTVRTVIEELCKNKKIIFEMDASHAQIHTLNVDKVRFDQIFINLLSNAVKFTPEGGKIELIILNHSQPQENIYVKRFIVKDNGIGMSEEFLPHAFESFKQEYRKDISEKTKGTGLGLAIVKEIVELMNGEISVESEIGHGTTFTIDLPLEVIRTQESVNVNISSEKSLEGIHILLGEDNDINTEIAVALLEKQGCLIDCAEDGKETWEMFEKSKEGYYDVILMDIRMPVMDGLESARAIRASKRADAKTIPIIALTADVFCEDARIAKEAGMNTLLTKPIEPRVLYQTLSEYLAMHS